MPFWDQCMNTRLASWIHRFHWNIQWEAGAGQSCHHCLAEHYPYFKLIALPNFTSNAAAFLTYSVMRFNVPNSSPFPHNPPAEHFGSTCLKGKSSNFGHGMLIHFYETPKDVRSRADPTDHFFRNRVDNLSVLNF